MGTYKLLLLRLLVVVVAKFRYILTFSGTLKILADFIRYFVTFSTLQLDEMTVIGVRNIRRANQGNTLGFRTWTPSQLTEGPEFSSVKYEYLRRGSS